MQITLLKSKLHRATITDSELHYVGSITIDPVLLDAANMLEYEKVDVLNVNNGQRFTTYIIAGTHHSGEVIVNGAAARLVQRGDLVIICAFAQLDADEAAGFSPTVIQLDTDNRIAV